MGVGQAGKSAAEGSIPAAAEAAPASLDPADDLAPLGRTVDTLAQANLAGDDDALTGGPARLKLMADTRPVSHRERVADVVAMVRAFLETLP